MFSTPQLRWLAVSAGTFSVLSLGISAAVQDEQAASGSLDDVSKVRRQGNVEGIESQKRVDDFSDKTDTLFAKYSTTLKQIDAIGVYNHQMRGLIASQEEELASLEDQLDRVELVGRSVTPLMLRMIVTSARRSATTATRSPSNRTMKRRPRPSSISTNRRAHGRNSRPWSRRRTR